MAIITLPAHFDGKQIRLDEPYFLQPNTRLLVTVLPMPELGDEQTDWYQLASYGLARAYADDEAEYPTTLIKDANLDYEGG